MRVTDQPGRVAAVFLVAPVFVATGIHLRRSDRYRTTIGAALAIFGAVFFLYEIFWISCAPPKACDV